MKKILFYGTAFFLTIVLCMGMLLAATFAPQQPIDENVLESVQEMLEEGTHPAVLDKKGGAYLDNWTDALILMESKAMSSGSKSTILTNPLYIYGDVDTVTALAEYAQMVKPTPSDYYTRYWMGFRAVIRWLLVFFNYFQIRRYVAFGVFAVLFMLVLSIARHLDDRHAAVFALCILLVRPYVICSSPQYACCFLIAFSAMLAVPWIHKNPRFQSLFFMELGMLTMYFDFYTTPIITFGLPMIYLCLLRAKDDGKLSVATVLKNTAIWLASYLGMWISKLVLTDLLTDKPGILNALGPLTTWLGVPGQRDESYSPILALKAVWRVIAPDAEAAGVLGLAGAVLAVFLLVKAFRRKLDLSRAKCCWGILVIALFPLIWFCVSSKPIQMHDFFQYRSIVVLYWAIGGYLCLVVKKGGKEGIPERNLKESEK